MLATIRNSPDRSGSSNGIGVASHQSLSRSRFALVTDFVIFRLEAAVSCLAWVSSNRGEITTAENTNAESIDDSTF